MRWLRWPILACISAFSCKYLHNFISKIKFSIYRLDIGHHNKLWTQRDKLGKLTLESYRKSTYVKSFIHLSIVVETLCAFINGTTRCEINSDGWSTVFTSARLFLNRATNSTRENSSGPDCFSIYDGSLKLQNWLRHPDSHLFCAYFLHSLSRVCKLAQYYWRT